MKRGGGGFDFDQDLLDQQKKQMELLSKNKEVDEFQDPYLQKKEEGDGKSLQDLMKEKRQKTEKFIEENKPKE